MIDIYTHILPKIDDEAENIDITLEMLKGSKKKSIFHFCNKSKMKSLLY